jgi:hypothetical protein
MDDHLLLTQLDRPHHLVRREIKMLDHRTTCRTFLTLIAEKDILHILFEWLPSSFKIVPLIMPQLNLWNDAIIEEILERWKARRMEYGKTRTCFYYSVRP